MAFGIESSGSGEVKNDSKVFKWVAKYVTAVSGTPAETYIKLHHCTGSDFARFHQPAKHSEARIQNLNDSGGLFCIDWQSADIELYGA